MPTYEKTVFVVYDLPELGETGVWYDLTFYSHEEWYDPTPEQVRLCDAARGGWVQETVWTNSDSANASALFPSGGRWHDSSRLLDPIEIDALENYAYRQCLKHADTITVFREIVCVVQRWDDADNTAADDHVAPPPTNDRTNVSCAQCS